MIGIQDIRLGIISRHRFRCDMCVSFFQLSQLLNAGVSVERAIADLCELEVAPAVRRVWSDISLRVSSGQTLPVAMQHWEAVFDHTTVALMKAAHANGELSAVCHSIYEYLQWQLDVRSRMQAVLVYPLFSLSVLSAVIVFLLLVVVPSLRGFILSSNGPLAWHTQFILQVSDWSAQYLFHGLLALAGVVVVIAVSARSFPIFRLLWDSIILKLPLLGALVVNLSLSRYSRCCAHLYGSGVNLEESLLLAEATVSNQVLRADLGTVRLSMVRGVKLADSLSSIRSIPGLFKRMVSIGEASGVLGTTLLHLSQHQAMSTELSLKRVEQLIGPSIMLLAGSSLLWVVVSVLGPVYNTAISVVLSS